MVFNKPLYPLILDLLQSQYNISKTTHVPARTHTLSLARSLTHPHSHKDKTVLVLEINNTWKQTKS